MQSEGDVNSLCGGDEDPFSDDHEIVDYHSPSEGNPFDDEYGIKDDDKGDDDDDNDNSSSTDESDQDLAMVGPRNVAHAEESAEVEVLYANLDKLKTLTKKMQGSLTRLETNGRVVKEAIGPVHHNTQSSQTVIQSTAFSHLEIGSVLTHL